MNDNDGWVKIHRRLLSWRWYDDTNMVRLFLHLLLKANYEDKGWRDITIHRGQLVTSSLRLAEETNLSRQVVRTCLQRMVECEFLTIKATNKYTLITICNYESYQAVEQPKQPTKQPSTNHQLTNKQPTNNQQITTTKEIKKERNKEIKNNNNMLTHIVSANTQQFYDWLKENCPYLYDNLRLPTDEQFERLCSTYGSRLIADICLQIENRADLRKKYKVLYPTLLNWLKKETTINMTQDEREREKRLQGYAEVAAQFLNGEVRHESAVLDVVPF